MNSLVLSLYLSGPPRQGRQAKFGPCLDFGFQYALIRNNWSKNFGVEYWPFLAQIRRGGPAYVLKRQEILKRTLFSFRSKQT